MRLNLLLNNIDVLSYGPDLITDEVEIDHITDNSSEVRPGSLFIAIPGRRTDGHKYIKDALDRGASAVIAQRDEGHGKTVVVKDSAAAEAVACSNLFGNPDRLLRLIGITGTNGKTTTSTLIKELLELFGKKCGLLGTVANFIGDKEYPAALTTPKPFELFRMMREMVDAGCEFCVMEVSSQALAQQRVYGVRFDVGVFSNITRDHLDFHLTMEAYAEAKAQLFAQSDISVINCDDEYAEMMRASAAGMVFTYSADGSSTADYRARNIKFRPDGITYDLEGFGKIARLRLGIPGDFTVYNSMAAAVAMTAIGFDLGDVAEKAAQLRGVKGRIEVVPTDTEYTVIIDYAHTPDGIENILRSVRKFCEKKLFVVFGAGGDRDKTKRPLMGEVASSLADVVIVTSDNPRTEDPAAIINDILPGIKGKKPVVIPDRTQAIKYALENASAGDIIVLCGKGHETYQILNTGKIHYDEREIVAGLLEEMGK